ncbi:MAG: hypothetical protein ACR2QA_16600 [Solirubrobacteraceae bacterium]
MKTELGAFPGQPTSWGRRSGLSPRRALGLVSLAAVLVVVVQVGFVTGASVRRC